MTVKKSNEQYEEHYFNETRKNSNLYEDFDWGSYYIVQSLDNRYSVSLIETLPQAIQEAKKIGEPCIIIEQKYTPICYVGDEDLYYTYKK